MRGPTAAVGLMLLLMLSGCFGGLAQGPDAEAPTGRRLLVVYGDSFTRAAELGVGDHPERSWATGTLPAVESVFLRLRQEHPLLEAQNVARSGARIEELALQVAQGPPHADLVLVWFGINDACWPQPTTPDDFRAHAATGLDSVRAAHPDASVIVFAVPDLGRLASLSVGVADAAAFWIPNGYCRDYYFPLPASSGREEADQRLSRLNEILKGEAEHRGFGYSAGTRWPGFDVSDLSSVDYFHPNAAGEARIASAAWPSVQALA